MTHDNSAHTRVGGVAGHWLRRQPGLAWLVSLAPVLMMFVLACWQMQRDWTHSEEYHYGWAVPVLTAYLLSLRWRDRPGAASPLRSPRRQVAGWDCGDESPQSKVAVLRLAGWVAAGLMLLFAWLVQEANPGWRPIAIAMTVAALVAAWSWLGDVGGRAWQWHFAGAVTFFAVAIPWPQVIENAVTGVLMPLNAAMTLEVLHWLGIPAVRSGNLITLSAGTLGVEEACSGIRSLQATLMMALFLGEFHALPLLRRAGLLGLGVGVALLTNAARTVFLSTVAARSGLEAAAHWHDGLGLAVLAIHAGTLAFCALSWGRRRKAPEGSIPPVSPSAFPSPQVSGFRFQVSSIPLRGPVVLLILIAISPLFTQLWYHRPKPQVAPLAWKLVPPTGVLDFTPTPIPERLHQDEGWSAKWHSDREHLFHAFFCAWRADGLGRVGDVAGHRPELCLSDMGMVAEEESPEGIPIKVAGRVLPVRCLKFNDHGRALFVAFLEESPAGFGPAAAGIGHTYFRRLGAVWRGQRNEAQRLLEIGLWGAASEGEAKKMLRDFLEKHIAVEQKEKT